MPSKIIFCTKVFKSGQKVVKKLSKIVKKLPKSCQKVVKKLSKSCQKSCQKVVKKVGKKMAKLKIGCKKTKILKPVGEGGGEGDL
jgi:predicted translin family RNA/ssDNA-binding protein